MSKRVGIVAVVVVGHRGPQIKICCDGSLGEVNSWLGSLAGRVGQVDGEGRELSKMGALVGELSNLVGFLRRFPRENYMGSRVWLSFCCSLFLLNCRKALMVVLL